MGHYDTPTHDCGQAHNFEPVLKHQEIEISLFGGTPCLVLKWRTEQRCTNYRKKHSRTGKYDSRCEVTDGESTEKAVIPIAALQSVSQKELDIETPK